MKKRAIILSLLAFWCIFLIIPIAILIYGGIDADSINPLFIANLKVAIKNSLGISLCVSFLSMIISYATARLIVKYHYKIRNKIVLILTIPMLVPTFTHALGFISFWGRNGFVNNLLKTNINIYGFWGVVLCTLCYGVPLSLIMFIDLLSSENHVPYLVAKTLGIPKLHQFIKIRLPFIFKSSIMILFTVFTMAITDYGIPMMIGGKTITLTTMLYSQIVGRLNFGTGAFLSIILLIPSIFTFIISFKMKNYKSFEYRIEDETNNNKLFKSLSILVYIMVFLIISFPMISCLFISFVKKFPIDLTPSLIHVKSVIQNGYLKYLINSLIISFFTAIIGTLISFLFAYIATREMNRKLSKLFHLLAISTSSIPGIVLAIAYMVTFKNTLIYGTISILVIINIVRYMGMTYLMLYNSLDRIDKTIEVTSLTLGIPQNESVKDIIIPQIMSSITESFSYIFVNTMTSVTTMLFLSTAFTKPLALVIVELEAHNNLEMAAFVSFIILIINIIIKYSTYHFAKKNNN